MAPAAVAPVASTGTHAEKPVATQQPKAVPAQWHLHPATVATQLETRTLAQVRRLTE